MISRSGYQQLGRDFRLDPKRASRELREAFHAGEIKPDEFSLRQLAEHTVDDGREWLGTMDPRYGNNGFLEAVGAVSTVNFSNITGQIIYNKILEASMPEDYIFSQIIPTIPTQFNGERIPGITGLGDAALIVNEGDRYPHAGVNEDWIDTPATVKRGTIVPVTKEAIFFDRTGLVLMRASEVGGALGLNKEKRVIDCMIDETTTAHRYKWKGNVIQTYGDNSGTHSWDNLSATTTLLDYTSINALELLMAALLDPNTGEPMSMFADSLIVTPQLAPTAWRILNSMHVDNAPLGWDVDSLANVTRSASPLGKTRYSPGYRILSSRLLAARMGLGAAEPLTSWYLGAPSKAFAYMENWPITVTEAPPNSTEDFNRDIVAQYKASERGAAATLEPRYMCKATV